MDAWPALQRLRMGLSPGLHSCRFVVSNSLPLFQDVSFVFHFYSKIEVISTPAPPPALEKTFLTAGVAGGEMWCWVWVGQECG